MSDLTNPRFLCIPLLLLSIPFFIQRLFRAQDAANRQFVTKLLMINLLILIPSYNVYQESTHISLHWWQYVLGNVVLQAIVLLQYFTVDQFLNGDISPLKMVVKHNVFLVTISFSIMMGIVDYLRRDHFASVTDPESFERSWMYVASQLCYNLPLIYVISMMVKLYWKNLSQYKEPSFVVRRVFNMLGLTVAVTIMLIALVNTFVSLAVNNPYRILLYSLVQNVGRPTVFLLIILGTVIPQPIIEKLLFPLKYFLAQRERRQRELLCYLHERLIHLVPSIHLPNEQLRDLRVLTEIEDARDVIWGQVPQTQPMKAREEAAHLFHLLRNNDIISQPGEHIPPSIQGNVLKHNVAVARYLRRFEARGARHGPGRL